MRRSLIAFLLFLSFWVSGQNILLIDSLRKKLKNASPNEKFAIWNAIGFDYRYSYPDSTIYYCTQAFELGKKLDLTKDLSKPLSFIGLAAANKGDYKSSIDYHQLAIEIAAEQNDSIQLAFGYNNLGRMFFDQGDLVRAYDNLIRSKDIFEVSGDKSGLAYVYRSLSNLYKSQKEYGKALDMSQKAYELRAKLGEPRTLTSSLLELGLVYQAMGQTGEALNCFKKADSISMKFTDRVTKAELRLGMAEILFETGDKKAAFEATQNVLSIITDKTNQHLFLRASLLQAKYFLDQKNDAKALVLLQLIVSEAERSGTPSYQRDASLLLSEIYKRRKNTVLSNEYSSKYKILNEMLQNTDLNRQIDRLQFQLEIEKKERENEVLKAEQAKSIALIGKQRIQNIMLVIVVISITAIATIAWYNNRRRRLINHKLALQNSHIVTQREEISKQNENLFLNNQTLQDLNQEKNTLMNIVAHDLKSPLNQIYGLANLMEIEGGLPAQQQEYIQLMKEATRSGLDLITDLLDVNELEEIKDVPKKEWINVEEVIKSKIKSFHEAADNKSIRIEYHNEVTEKIFSDATYLGRILDNLVSNAIKFSPKSTSIHLSSSVKTNVFVLKVKDEGPGFSTNDHQFLFQKFKKLSARPTGGESSNGLGLAIVKTLVDRLNGEISLVSHSGKGSLFEVKIPAS
ncbi:MAG TPA: ATP-binding protein [Cyclobacteriaceae bacterium]